MLPVSTLLSAERNVREHPEEQLALLEGSIREFGFVAPVLVDADNRLIAGHGRVEAAKRAGVDKVPAVLVDHLTDEQKRAYILADNKIALEANWNLGALKEELAELADLLPSLEVTGFTTDELDALLEPADDAGTADKPALGAPVIQYNIIFDSEGQQARWFDFLRYLKAKYPDAETIGERLALYVEEQSFNG